VSKHKDRREEEVVKAGARRTMALTRRTSTDMTSFCVMVENDSRKVPSLDIELANREGGERERREEEEGE
jgi:hypothetical protein